MASSISAASRTVRVIGPACDSSSTALAGYCGMRPHDGFSPKTPQNPEGMRIEPAPSVPCDRGPIPLATAAAAPPLDPPAVCPRFQGFCVGSIRRLLESPFQPISGVLVLPRRTAPAS